MANNAFNFKGIYDKIAGLLKNSDIQDTYIPVDTDYIAIYKNVPGSPIVGDNTVAMKEYVPVTEIGGGGPLPDNVMTSFYVSSTGGVTLSVDSGVTYGEGPFTIEDLDSFIINSSSVPNGLNWRGSFLAPSTGTIFEINDVVYTTTGSPAVYRTWFAIQQQNVSGAVAPPTGTEYSNAYWALLGTQGPPGEQGAQGQPSATATFGFVPKNTNGTSVGILVAGNVGTSGNDIGKVLLVNNSSTSVVADVTIQLNMPGTGTGAAGWPYNSQITVINVSAETSAAVRVTAVGNVNLRSADGAQYLRTQYSTCSVVRRDANEYFMFGDLTNIA